METHDDDKHEDFDQDPPGGLLVPVGAHPVHVATPQRAHVLRQRVALAATALGTPRSSHDPRQCTVDSFLPNPWGLYNVHGNVWEWTQGCLDSNSGNPGDCSGAISRRVLRGGSFADHVGGIRAATREWSYVGGRGPVDVGFRVARTLTR
jgi:formylglycine-generating enzyme required for sulfatase activity